jgi:hypothetical protein
LGDEVIGHLVVGEPVERVPEKDLAGNDTTANLVDPGVVESHPGRGRLAVGTESTGLDTLPETLVLENVLLGALLECKPDELGSAAHDRSSRGRKLVVPLEEQ